MEMLGVPNGTFKLLKLIEKSFYSLPLLKTPYKCIPIFLDNIFHLHP